MNTNFLALTAILTGAAALAFFYISEKKRGKNHKKKK